MDCLLCGRWNIAQLVEQRGYIPQTTSSTLVVPIATKNYNQLSCGNTLRMSACREMGAFLLKFLMVLCKKTFGRMRWRPY